MTRSTLLNAIFGVAFVVCLQFAPAQAQAPRYVATFGDNGNNCASPAQACRTLSRAHQAADPRATIYVLDSGNFSPVTINKSISIIAAQADATAVGGASSQISVFAGADDVVHIEGMDLFGGFDTHTHGIRLSSGGRLHVRRCSIRDFSVAGILIETSAQTRVVISNCAINHNREGIWVRPTGSANSRVMIDRVTFDGNTRAIRAQNDRAVVRVSNSVIVNNNRGLHLGNGGGRIATYGNNVLFANGNDGEFTGKAALR